MEDHKDENIDLNNDGEETTSENLEETVEDFETDAISDEIEEKSASELKADAEEIKERTVTSGGSSKSLTKMLALVGVMVAIGAGLVYWKTTVAEHHGDESSGISKEEMELLVKDFPPAQRKALAESDEQKKQLANNIEEIMAISSEAQKSGYANDPLFEKELEFSKKALYAANYDKKINADKGPMPQFGFITEDRVKEFWGEDKDLSGLKWIWNGAEKRRNEAQFKTFLDTKIALAKKTGQIPKDKEPAPEEIELAKAAFAKTMIYYNEVKEKLADVGSLSEDEQKEWKEWEESVKLQTKLQKAQFLTQNYVRDVLSKKFEVTDADIEKYLEEHPELAKTEDKKKLAEEILQKVKDGGDFAELAKEHSEDPGSKNKGGLYEGISPGQFAKEFETAAMALEPGEYTEELVKTNFGYHIIKLEKKGETKGGDGKTKPTYDVRHILISTMVKDPDNPAAREQPLEQMVKAKLAKSKQKSIIDEVKENNAVNVPTDFEVPEVSEEELNKQKEEQKKLMEQRMKQMQKQQGAAPPNGAAPQPQPAKPAPKQPQAEKK